MLHIFGVGLAIACFLFIFTFISYQQSFDTFHSAADRTFILVEDLHLDKVEHSKGGSYAMFDAINSELPQIERAALYIDKEDIQLKVGSSVFKTDGKAAYTSSAYFSIFDQPWISGVPDDLNKPNTVAITRSWAQKYFPDKEAMGQTILAEGRINLTVVGIIDDRQNSDFRSDIYISLSSLAAVRDISKNEGFFHMWGYTNSANNIIVTLRNPQDQKIVEQEIRNLVAKHWHKDVLKYYTYKLLPLKLFHFDTDYGKGMQQSLLLILAVIATAILLMAVVNYCNIMSAQQFHRHKEMGIRKILGSSKQQLFAQYLTESILVSFLALLFAFVLLYFFLQWSNTYLLATEPIYILSITNLLFTGIGIWLFVVLLTSLYPAFSINNIQSRINWIEKKQKTKNWGMKSLIVFQNTIALLLISATIVIVQQAYHLKNTDVGFSRNKILILPLRKETVKNQEKLLNFLRGHTDVESFSRCENPPANDKVWGGTFQFDNREEWETWPARYAIADSSYLTTFGIKLLTGRNFKEDQVNPEFLINEKMVKNLGLTDVDEAVGKRLHAGGLNDAFVGTIVGVVQDFNTNSLYEPISPTVVGYNAERIKKLAIKYTGHDLQGFLATMESSWKTWYPDQLFEYNFYDDQIVELYQKEILLEKLIWIAAVVAILISILGILGLLSINIIKRSKEIGIRKVLGSSIRDIAILLAQDFLKWIALAFVISVPISLYILEHWLNNFAFRIDLKWWMFSFAGLACLLITSLSIAYQVVKAAYVNPVNSLRDE
ncbi:ABC transporter permease [Sphingobacterium sp. LRF_L2]|uniref:ABC transporter permease n=1 Tax=Sphingobacterium sp. LRF_L2 TaxID=3369421 RepID=UPI003F5FC868